MPVVPVYTREQQILDAIASAPLADPASMESRAESLAAMLLRHGALPVKLFLLAKGESDARLWNLVERGIKAIWQEEIDARAIAKLPFERYLLLNEVAVEAATLAARWIKVQRAPGG